MIADAGGGRPGDSSRSAGASTGGGGRDFFEPVRTRGPSLSRPDDIAGSRLTESVNRFIGTCQGGCSQMKSRKFTKIVVFVLIIAVAAVGTALLASCGSSGGGGSSASPSTGGGGGETIKIGTLYPVTGDLAKLGQECVNGVKLATKEINAAGGIKSMGGAQIALIEADSQGKPDVGISEVERLAQQDNVSAILGTYQSSVAIPATQAAQRLQVPILISMAIADEVTQKGYQYVFRICPTADYYAKTMIEFCGAMSTLAPAYPPIKKVALLHEDTDFGQSTATGLKKYAKQAGIEITTEVAYPGSAADLTTQVAKVLASNPDIVLTTTYLNDAILIAQAKEKLGAKMLFFDSAGGTVDPEFVKRLGAAAEKELTEIEYTKFAGDAAMGFNDRYKAEYGTEPSSNGAYGYQAMYVLAKALEDGKSADRAQLQKALAAVSLDTAKGDTIVIPSSTISFGPDGQFSAPLFVVQVQNGALAPVYPVDFANAKVQLP
jgi:branched-chain amino acid transport system substrate-binding protein